MSSYRVAAIRRWRRAWFFALFVAVFASLTTSAHAQEASEAAKHFKRGSTLYYLQRYHEAAAEYEKAYEAKDAPDILFNIGQAYRLGGEYQKALGAYRSYLSLLPDVKNRNEVVALIENCKNKLQAQRADELAAAAKRQEYGPQLEPKEQPVVVAPKVDAPPPAVVVPPPPLRVVDQHELKRGRKLRVAGFAVTGVGVAAAVVGGVFAGMTSGVNHQLNNPAKGATFDRALESRGRTDQAVETGLFVVGGAAIVAGVTTLVIGTKKIKRNSFALAPAIGPNRVGATLGFEF